MTSIIPINLDMPTYQDPARLASMLSRHIDELAQCAVRVLVDKGHPSD